MGGASAKCGVLNAAGTLGAHFPSSFAWLAAQNRKCIVGQGLTESGAVGKRCGVFRNFPFRSVSFRSVPPYFGWFRTDPLLPGAECLPSPHCLVPGARCLFRSRGLSGVAGFAAKNKEGIVPQGLTDLGEVAKLSVSFRFFPKLSETFRFVPFRSGVFRPDASGFRFVPLRSVPIHRGSAWFRGPAAGVSRTRAGGRSPSSAAPAGRTSGRRRVSVRTGRSGRGSRQVPPRPGAAASAGQSPC